MDVERSRQLRDIVGMSTEMLSLALENEWERVSELEAARRELVTQSFQQSTSQQDAAEVAVAIKEILRLNQEISDLAKAHQQTLGVDLRNNRTARTAREAYLACAR